MRKDFLFILLLIWMGFLGGCRAKSETSSSRSSTVAADVGTFPFTGDCGGGLGAVKSIEILTEKTEDMGGIRTTDSVSGQKSYTKETLQKETETETRHDNGTVAILAVVAGLVVLALAWLLIKTYLKR